MMADDIKISGHAGFTMGPVARWVCVNSDGFTVAYVDTIERAQRLIRNAAAAEREDVLVEALRIVAGFGGNLPDEEIENINGINDGKSRAIMYSEARKVARKALANTEKETR